MSFSRRTLLALCAVFGVAGGAAAQTVIYQDDFSGSADESLAGRAPIVASGEAGGDAKATWASGDHWKADGTVASGPTQGQRSALNQFSDNGLLPFKPSAGHMYTLTVTMTRASDSPENWLWAGFASAELEAGGTRARPNSGDRGTGWMVAPISGGIQTFLGPGAEGGKVRPRPALESGEPFTLKIVLDTETDRQDWILEWYVNDRRVRGPESIGGVTVGGQEITQVGFGRYINAGGSISHFSLTVE